MKMVSRGRLVSSIAVVALVAAVSACQPRSGSFTGSDSLTTGSTDSTSYKGTAQLGQAWQADQKNVGKGLAFAKGLDALGQSDQQLSVLSQLSHDHPDDPVVATTYGKALLKQGRGSDALPVLERAAAAPGADWRLHNTLASAYDQQGQFDQAQAEYATALKLQPNELSVLNNMAMSMSLHGDLKKAEQTLRAANALPNAKSEPRLRQNLALVVGLQGRYDEARKIASEDLPPDQVEANLDYLKQMSTQSNTWQQLSEGKG